MLSRPCNDNYRPAYKTFYFILDAIIFVYNYISYLMEPFVIWNWHYKKHEFSFFDCAYVFRRKHRPLIMREKKIVAHEMFDMCRNYCVPPPIFHSVCFDVLSQLFLPDTHSLPSFQHCRTHRSQILLADVVDVNVNVYGVVAIPCCWTTVMLQYCVVANTVLLQYSVVCKQWLANVVMLQYSVLPLHFCCTTVMFQSVLLQYNVVAFSWLHLQTLCYWQLVVSSTLCFWIRYFYFYMLQVKKY